MKQRLRTKYRKYKRVIGNTLDASGVDFKGGAVAESVKILVGDIVLFVKELKNFLFKSFGFFLHHSGRGKGFFVSSLYARRGKLATRFVHSSMAVLAAFGVVIAPVIAQEFPGTSVDPWELPSSTAVLSASTYDPTTETLISEKARDSVIEYEVKEGDTVSTIAEKFGVSQETILWQNGMSEKDSIKPGDVLEVLPVTGVSHKVKKGDTVYSIAKKYDTVAQGIVDYPFNSFTNDETFELAAGQTLVVPDGIIPKAQATTPRKRFITPDAGTVVASGNFVWPTSGGISQGFTWYHKGLDISNRGAPNILAADAGKVVIAGWLDGYGYGNRVVIDHGNGFRTLYAHMSSIFVNAGQRVNRGDVLGRMGCTGRCTGTHLHFEVIRNGVYLNPLSVLK